MASPATDGPQSATAPAVLREALGSLLLCAGAFGVARWRGTAPLDQDPLRVVACALALGALAFSAISVLGRGSRTMFVPNGAFAGLVRERLSHDATAMLVVVELGAAALVGIMFGAVDRQPIAGVPDLWSWGNLRELVAAIGLAYAACRGGRATTYWVAAVFAFALIGGTRFLGNPAFLLGDAFANGATKIGPVLVSHTLGILLGVTLPRCRGHDVVAVGDRPS